MSFQPPSSGHGKHAKAYSLLGHRAYAIGVGPSFVRPTIEPPVRDFDRPQALGPKPSRHQFRLAPSGRTRH